MKLGQVFDPRNNALNAWRLVLATGVILWHSFPLTGWHVRSRRSPVPQPGIRRRVLCDLGIPHHVELAQQPAAA